MIAAKSYDSFHGPVMYGSGGGNGVSYEGGRGGGHVIFDVSNVLRLEGRIHANGERPSDGGGGAGGSIVIRALNFDGEGSVEVNGGTGFSDRSPYSGGGGGGRIAVYYEGYYTFIGSFQAYGGSSRTEKGGAGTVYIENRANQSSPYRVLKMDNGISPTGQSRLREVQEVSLSGNPTGYPYYLVSYQSPSGIIISTTGTPYCRYLNSHDGKRCSSDNSVLGNLFSSGSYYTTHGSPVITYQLPLSMFLEYLLVDPTCSSGHYTPYFVRVFLNGSHIAGSGDWVDPTYCIASQPEKLVVRRIVDKVRLSGPKGLRQTEKKSDR